MKMPWLICLLCLACSGLVWGQTPTIAIVGAQVFDGTGREPFAATVIIKGERIVAVASDAQAPEGATVIRVGGQTLLPGLFDLHTHLPYATAGRVTPDWPRNLQTYLYCGVTSVADFGTYGETFAPMRQLLQSGAVAGPRISLAARMSTPGGHGAEGGRGTIFTAEALTPREARAAVKRLHETYKPDVIKVFTDGWRYGTASDMTSMEEPTLAALVDEAHKRGMKVLTHTVTLEKAKIAVRAGVDVLAHGIGNAPVDGELLQLMRAKNTAYASTLAVYEPRGTGILSPLLDEVLDPETQAAARLTPPGQGAATVAENPARIKRWGHLNSNLAALHRAGANIANGTDAGVTGTYHGWATIREIELAVNAGLPPLAALTAATGNSAKALGVENERGFIMSGKLADLVLVDGQPHHNINDLEKISRVWLGGKELDRAQMARHLATSAPTVMPAAKAQEKLDDVERGDGRTQLDTLWIDSTDGGHDHSQALFQRILREPNDHALALQARMSEKERPFARLTLPLTRGAVIPVDARAFRGVRFDVRGEGNYRFIAPTVGVRDGNFYQTNFAAGGKWQNIKIEFAKLKQRDAREIAAPGDGAGDDHFDRAGLFTAPELPLMFAPQAPPAPWTGADLLSLVWEIARPAGQSAWLEIDNVRFYK
jgi:imidazolonepropionase-like amidohydrolase